MIAQSIVMNANISVTLEVSEATASDLTIMDGSYVAGVVESVVPFQQ